MKKQEQGKGYEIIAEISKTRYIKKHVICMNKKCRNHLKMRKM